MKKHEMTDWFPADLKPVHIGVYEVRYFPYGKYCLWDGKKWSWTNTTVNKAYKFTSSEGANQNKIWRGIEKDMT